VDDNIGSRPAIGLGGVHRGVTPLEMAAAYATFAAKGAYAAPYSVTRIVSRRGEVVYEHQTSVHQVLDPKEAGVLNGTLEQVVQRGTATAANLAGRVVAGKTGTTSNFYDAWFVGYVPQLSTAVWVGYPDRHVSMRDIHGRTVFGGTFPAKIWADAMRPVVAGLPAQPLFTASPDELSLHPLDTTIPPATPPSVSTTSTASTTSSLPPTTAPGGSTTVPGKSTTSTTAPGDTTTTSKGRTTTTSSSSTTTTAPTSTTASSQPAQTTTTVRRRPA